MKETDIAWIAGIIEGEGHIGIRRRARGRIPHPENGFRYEFNISVSMTDEDVVQALKDRSGLGVFKRIHSPAHVKRGSKPLYRWLVSKRSEVEELFDAILPYMFNRRSARIREAQVLMDEFRSNQGQRTDLMR